MKRIAFVTALVLILLAAGWIYVGWPQNVKLESINLPDGFKIDVYASNVPNARSMTLSKEGILFVGSRNAGKVYAVIDNNNDKKADEVVTVASGLHSPNGVAILGDDLYVAEISRVLRFKNIADNFRNKPISELINDSFPQDEWHGWKYIKFGPDGWLYVPVGAPCNVCDSEDPRYASIMRMKPSGDNLEIYARGIRNTVGFDWHPITGNLWFTDNGRDWMGENAPPDELNRAEKPGLHFGFPYCHGKNIEDPSFSDSRHSCSIYQEPEQELGAHVAALGMIFYTGKMFPEEYKNQIFIAEHGSWNRVVPVGYRMMLVKLEGNKALSYEVFADGWLKAFGGRGRPVDLVQMQDGSLLVSDDRQGMIYRISYAK